MLISLCFCRRSLYLPKTSNSGSFIRLLELISKWHFANSEKKLVIFCVDVLGNDKLFWADVSGHVDDSITQFFNIFSCNVSRGQQH